ncbi:MAG: recombinase family protein [Parcubacteria group bacterium]
MSDTPYNGIHLTLAIYGRVSTSLQEDQKTIKNQIMEIKDFANKKFGEGNYTIIKEYLDEGWSGDEIERPQLDELRLDARRKAWDAVIIYDPDRLSRRSEWQSIVKEEIEELGIDVFFVTIPQAKTDEDKIMSKMRGVFAEYERMKIKERFRIGKVRKVKEGHILVSEPLYGYRYIPNKEIPNQPKVHGYYEVNPVEEKVAKKIFAWVGEDGLTLRQVVRKLQELKIKPRKSERGVWSTSTLSTMLRNEAYIGKARWGSSYAVVPEKPFKNDKYKKIKKSSRKIKPKEEWTIIPVPAIIEEELFDKVQAQLKINFAQSKRNKKNEYLIAGKVYCVCGKRRTGEGAMKGKHLYYRCTDRVLSFPLPRTCMEGGINAKVADELIWRKISTLMSSPDLLLKQAERFLKKQRTTAKISLGDTKVLVSEIKKLKEKEMRYNKAFGAGAFTIEQLKELTGPVREEIMTIETQIERINQETQKVPTNELPNKEEILSFAKKAANMLENLSFATKRAIMLDVINKVVGAQRHLQVYGNIPLTLNHVSFKTINRHSWSAQCRQVYPF